jgi:hypothetical protein
MFTVPCLIYLGDCTDHTIGMNSKQRDQGPVLGRNVIA